MCAFLPICIQPVNIFSLLVKERAEDWKPVWSSMEVKELSDSCWILLLQNLLRFNYPHAVSLKQGIATLYPRNAVLLLL